MLAQWAYRRPKRGKGMTMTIKSALAILAKYAPCPHESYDDTLGNGKEWARCLDCGAEFKQEHHNRYQTAASDFQNALDVLTSNTQEETVGAERLHELLDQMGVPVGDDIGHTLTIEERMAELKRQRQDMRERLDAYGFSKPAEELLRVQRALLSRPHPDYMPALFVREVSEMFGFAPPPPVPDDVWYRSALAVIRNKLDGNNK